MYVRPISTRLLRGMLTPEMRAISASPRRNGALALPLLMAGIRADHQNASMTADDLAFFAHRLDRGSYFHVRPSVRRSKFLSSGLSPALETARGLRYRAEVRGAQHSSSRCARTRSMLAGAPLPSGGPAMGLRGRRLRTPGLVPGREDS